MTLNLPAATAATLSALALCLLCVALPVAAQSTGGSGNSREREALRRVQQALQQAQGQRDAAQAELAAAKAAQQAAEGGRQREAAALAGVRAELRRLQDEQARLQAELAQARNQATAQQAKASDELSGLQQQLQQRQRELQAAWAERDERTRANQALVLRLQALSSAQAGLLRQQQALYELGSEAAERLKGRSALREALIGDPLLGVAAVRARDEAERLQQRLDALRPGSPLPEPGAAPDTGSGPAKDARGG